jgi:hypothetical protein
MPLKEQILAWAAGALYSNYTVCIFHQMIVTGGLPHQPNTPFDF